MWEQVGLDFCTTCCGTELTVSRGLYGDQATIRCLGCNSLQS